MADTKVCKGCNKELPLDKFGKLKSARDGREGKCRDCRKAQRPRHQIVCKHCNKIFPSINKNAIYCGNECSSAAKAFSFGEVKEFFKSNGCELLDTEYKNSYEPLNYICECGTPSKINFHDFKEGHRCRECGLRKTVEAQTPSLQFISKEFSKKGYLLLTEIYKNSRQELDVICPKGHKDTMTFSQLRDGVKCKTCKKESKITKSCKKCGKEMPTSTKNAKYCSEECRGYKDRKRQSFDEIKRFIEVESNSGCVLVSTERSKHSALIVNLICKCGTPFKIQYYTFKKRKRECDFCSGAKNSIEFVRKIAEEKGCSVISEEYTNNHTKMKFRCACGEEFTTTFKSLSQQNKTTCDECTKKALSERNCKSNDDFDKDLFDVAGEDIVRVGDYKNMKNKVLVKHVVCGKEWSANPSDLLHKKSGCPFCAESKGESRIAEYLQSKNIDFMRQYKISECRNKRPLPFDFALFDSGNLSLLIEYDGVQHFDNTCFGGKGYKNIIKNDAIKNDYCLSNSIPLLRINYKEFENIETILKDALT